MKDPAVILNQLPCSGIVPTVSAPEPEEIASIFRDMITAGGINSRDTARVAAFAWYNGIEQDAVLNAFRSRGTAEILRIELATFPASAVNVDEIVSGYRFSRLSTFMLAKHLNRPDLGWALVILTVAAQADFNAVIECLSPQDDPSRIASFFLGTSPFTPPAHRHDLLSKLLALNDNLSIEVATGLMKWWIEFAVRQDDLGLDGAFSAIEDNPSSGAILLGAVIGSTSRYRSPRVAAEITQRADAIDRRIDEAGKKVFKNGRAIKLALKSAGIRDLDVLTAMCRWSIDNDFAPAASKALGHTAVEYLGRYFSSRQELTDVQASFGNHLTKWSVYPLVALASQHGIEIDIFESYMNGLATDFLSKMTRHRLFLEDRQRAILLITVAGLTAHNRSDAALLEAVRKAASRLELQPAGAAEVLDDDLRNELATKCGFIFPKQ